MWRLSTRPPINLCVLPTHMHTFSVTAGFSVYTCFFASPLLPLPSFVYFTLMSRPMKNFRQPVWTCLGIQHWELFFTFDAVLLDRSQYSKGPATGLLDTGFSWFPCVYKQMLRWFPRFQVATTCFSCSPPDLNLLVTDFIFCKHVK